MGYQSEQAERDIVETRTTGADAAWRQQVVVLVRSTRDHPDVRVGSSVRGAIDMVGLTRELAALRGVPLQDWHVGLRAATAALSGRIRLHESSGRTPEEVVRELYEGVFGAEPRDEDEEDGPPGEA
jgi:MoxR-like ATPase